MSYNEFAWYYDEFNREADYDALFRYVIGQLHAHGRENGILADLGCGTGDLTLMLAQAGYDVIGIDQSEEMLSVLREKSYELELNQKILLLQQDLRNLDLYGTIQIAVSTFDTFNHVGPLADFEKAIACTAFFMDKGGVFIFDLNTPYKHQMVLAGQTFTVQDEIAVCSWHNAYDGETGRVDITVNIEDSEQKDTVTEQFSEYSYPLDTVTSLLEKYGFATAQVVDGEDFGPVRPDSQRWIFTAVKQYTQEGKD